MLLSIFPTTLRSRRIGPRTGLALVVGSALLFGVFVSDAAAYRDGGVRFRGGAGFGRSRVLVRSSWNPGPRRFCGPSYGPRVRAFVPAHRYYHPRVIFGLGLRLGQPYHDYRRPVVLERDHYIIRDDDDVRLESAPNRDDERMRGGPSPSEEDFDVTNEPPPGSTYRDRFCDREFSTLDDYTEHLQHERHSQTIDIIEKRTGDRLHTLEFVHGEWQPQISE